MSTIIWIIIWVVLLVLEIFTTTFFCLFLSFGALAAILTSYLGLSLYVQLISFIIVTVFSILLLRKRFKKTFVGEKSDDIKSHQLVGEEAIVFEEINPHKLGSVTVRGTYWKAASDSHLEKNTIVEVLGTHKGNNLILQVDKIQN